MTSVIKATAPAMSITLSAAVLVCSLALPARGQETTETKPENVQNPEPAFFVRADVDRIDRVYREGEPLFINAICEQDAYLYVFYTQADGKQFLIYPNSTQKNNFVKAKQKVQIPAADDRRRWRIEPPFGKETILVVASKQPIENLEDPHLREKSVNAVTNQQTKALAATMKAAEPANWAKDVVEITTKAKTEPAVSPQARRYGVFFGVKNYQFREEALAASQELVDAGKADKLWDPDMAFAENNVAVMSSMFKSMGKLDDLRTYVSKDATKANLHDAITKWLPSVSKPGDTVVIYWSSHGSQMPDDDGDEADGIDEWLLVADYCDSAMLKQLIKKQTEGKLDETLSRRVDELKRVAAAAGEDNADEALCRYTSVTDDQFGNWIQSLAGRQVVVFLDTCHSGGFSVDEKALGPSGKNVAFDFLDGETNRLKDLGQSESVLITACTKEKSCYINHANKYVLEYLRTHLPEVKGEADFDDQIPPMFVFTYYLAESLVTMPAPTNIEQVHARCVERMREYFVKVNEVQRLRKDQELTPHEAIIYDKCTKPVILKP